MPKLTDRVRYFSYRSQRQGAIKPALSQADASKIAQDAVSLAKEIIHRDTIHGPSPIAPYPIIHFVFQMHFKKHGWVTQHGGLDVYMSNHVLNTVHGRRYDYPAIHKKVKAHINYHYARIQNAYLFPLGPLVGIRIGAHLTYPVAHGTCDTRQHTQWYTNEGPDGILTARLISPKSSGNNCGIQCLISFWKRKCQSEELKEPKPLRSKSYRKKMTWLQPLAPLTIHEFEFLGQQMDINVTILDSQYQKLFQSTNSSRRHCTIMNKDDHYWLLDTQPSINPPKKKREKKCNRCGVFITRIGKDKRHRCKRPRQEEKKHEEKKHEEECKRTRPEEEVKFELPLYEEDLKNRRNHHLFYGPAGTGKSYIISSLYQQYLSWGYTKSQVQILSTTGVSALLVKGRTIHSYFNIGVRREPPQRTIDRICANQSLYKQLRELRVIIVDEVSMWLCDVWFLVDRILRIVCQKDIPFGGVKLILLGDFLQLPPVSRERHYVYIFETKLWQEVQQDGLIIHYLRHGWRYKKQGWFNLLKRIRTNNVTDYDLQILKKRKICKTLIMRKFEQRNIIPTFILGRKNRVHQHNKKELDLLATPLKVYTVKFEGEEILGTTRYRNIPFGTILKASNIELTIALKIGARVMILANYTIDGVRLANGMVCEVLDTKANSILVRLADGKEVDIVYRHHVIEYRGYTIHIHYIPLCLCWALTVHKAQGKTLEGIIVDAARDQMFAASHFYTAVSRCPTMENVFFLRFETAALRINPRAYEFSKYCESWREGHLWNVTEPMKEPPALLQVRDTVNSCLTIRKKREYKTLLLAHTLFYDFETYYDENEDIEVPYFNHFEYYVDQKKQEEKTFCYLCNPIDIQKATAEYILDKVTIMADKYIAEKAVKKFSNIKPLYLCAFNGSGFDFHFLMQNLLTSVHASRYETNVTMKGTKIIYLGLWDNVGQRMVLQTHDIFNITLCSLSKAAKDFLQTSFKDVFPHGAVNHALLQQASYETFIQISLYDFPESMHKEVQFQIKRGLDLAHYPFHRKLHHYGPNDVLVMVELYKKMDSICQEITKTSILRFLTLSKMTWYGFLIHLPSVYLQKRARSNELRRTLLYRTNRNEDKHITQSIYGGKCLPRVTAWESPDQQKSYEEIKIHYTYLDVNGMYAHVMKKEEYPYGIHTHLDSTSDYLKEMFLRCRTPELMNPRLPENNFFICRMRYHLHPCEIEPMVGTKIRLNPNSEKPVYSLLWDTGVQEGWYTNIDLYLILKNQGVIEEIYEMYSWPKKGAIFNKWITLTLKGKADSKAAGELAKAKFYKTLANGCYGSSLQRMFDDVVIHVRSMKELDYFHTQYEWLSTVNFEEFRRGDQDVLIMKGRARVHGEMEWTDRPRYIGAFVLSWSRMLYDDIYALINPWRREGTLRSVNNQILYGDTDSFIVPHTRMEALIPHLHKESGGLTDEILGGCKDFAKIVRWISPAPKSYALQAVLPEWFRVKVLKHGQYLRTEGNDQIYSFQGKRYYLNPNQIKIEIVKIKGISHSGYSYTFKGREYKELTFQIMKDIFESDESVVINMNNRLRRKGVNLTMKDHSRARSCYTISRENLTRTLFKTKQFKRRRFITRHITVPIHWEGLSQISQMP